MKSPLAKALMTTSAKHIWTRTANRRELAKAIFFFNQIVFLIMFLFLPKLLIRHLEDFLLRGKCNKLVRFPAAPPARSLPAGMAQGRHCSGEACSVHPSTCCHELRHYRQRGQQQWHGSICLGGGPWCRPSTCPSRQRSRLQGLSTLHWAVSTPQMSLAIQYLLCMFPPVISPLSTGRGMIIDLEQ